MESFRYRTGRKGRGRKRQGWIWAGVRVLGRGRIRRQITAALLALWMLLPSAGTAQATGELWSQAVEASFSAVNSFAGLIGGGRRSGSGQSSSGTLKNTYLFQTTTGLKTGSEDKIEFFIITYTDTQGEQRSHFLFPFEDSLADSYETAAQVNNEQAEQDGRILQSYSYAGEDRQTPVALRELCADQFLFTLDEPIKTVDQVQVFAGGKGSWACQGFLLFRVDKLGGLYRANVASYQWYIDFEGELIAEVSKQTDGGFNETVSWNTDRLISYSAPGSPASGKDHPIQHGEDNLAVRIDFADTYMGGMECLATHPTDVSKTLDRMGLVETAAMKIRYVDRYGATRFSVVPCVLSAAEFARKHGVSGSEPTIGLAQQGESMVSGMFLPDFDMTAGADKISEKLGRVDFVLGGANVNNEMHFKQTAGQVGDEGRRLEESDSEEINVALIALYKLATAGTAQSAEDGGDKKTVRIDASMDPTYGTIRYDYNKGLPFAYRKFGAGAGEKFTPGTKELQLNEYTKDNASDLSQKASAGTYLVEIDTDTNEGAGTTAEISLEITYVNLEGQPKTTESIDVRTQVREFYGYWPGTGQDFAYAVNTKPGGTLKFLVPMQNVKVITGMNLRVSGERATLTDAWQISDFRLYTVNNVGSRTVTWQDISIEDGLVRMNSDRVFDRFIPVKELRFKLSDLTDYPTLILPNQENATAVGPSGEGWPMTGTPGGWSEGTDGGTGGGTSGTGTGGASGTGTGTGGTGTGGTSGTGTGGTTGGWTGGGSTSVWPGGWTSTSVDSNGWPTGIDVTERKAVDWSQLRYSMSYADAMQDLGFTKSRAMYKVTVSVDKDDKASASDNSGSKNLFYFRLVFQTGNSSFVLANQQLNSDGFRSGTDESFYITTNQDYGDVVAVQIIPDDLSGSSDMYDKLNIKSIQVTKRVNAALVPTWEANTVGWIGIDYHDDGESLTIAGRPGRSAGELTRVYTINGSTYSSSILFCVTTGQYAEKAPQFKGTVSAEILYDKTTMPGATETVPDVVKLMYEYINYNTDTQMNGKYVSDPSLMFRGNHTDRFILPLKDVKTIRSITFYMTAYEEAADVTLVNVSTALVTGTGSLIINSVGEFEQVYRNEGEGLKFESTCSSPPYKGKVLANTTLPQSFEVQFDEVEIQTNPNAQQWTSRVTKTPVSENDTLNLILFPKEPGELTASSMYDVTLTTTRSDLYDLYAAVKYTDSFSHPQQVSTGSMKRDKYNGKDVFYAMDLSAPRMAAVSDIVIQAEMHDISRDATIGIEKGVLQQVRNGVVVQAWDLAMAPAISDYPLSVGMRTTAVAERQRVQLQLGTDTTDAALDQDNTDLAVAIWYRTSLPGGRELRSPYVFLTEQGYTNIRHGQVLEVFFDELYVEEITGISIIAVGSISGSATAAAAVLQQVSKDTGEVVLQGQKTSFNSPVTISNVPSQMRPSGFIQLLTLRFVTDKATENLSGGTNGPVRMTLGYYNQNRDMRTAEFEDIRPFMVVDKEENRRFSPDSTAEIRMLVSDMEELRWIELEPYGGSGTASAFTGGRNTDGGNTGGVDMRLNDPSAKLAKWNLRELSAALGEGGYVADRSIGKMIVEGSPLRAIMADILLRGTVSTIQVPAVMENRGDSFPVSVGEDGGELDSGGQADLTASLQVRSILEAGSAEVVSSQAVEAGSTAEIAIRSGEGLAITPQVVGSAVGTAASLYSEIGGLPGQADLGDTRGYTRASISTKASEARERAAMFAEAEVLAATDSGKAAARRGSTNAAREAEMWESLQPQMGVWSTGTLDSVQAIPAGTSVSFYTARNYYGELISDTGDLYLESGQSIVFAPPRNYTGSLQNYRIVVTSQENAAASFVVKVTVGYEPDPTTKTQDQLSQEMIDAQTAMSDAQNESNENYTRIIAELTGKLQSLQSQIDRMQGNEDSGSSGGGSSRSGTSSGGSPDESSGGGSASGGWTGGGGSTDEASGGGDSGDSSPSAGYSSTDNSTADESSGSDSGAGESGPADSGAGESGPADSGAGESGPADSGAGESSPADSGGSAGDGGTSSDSDRFSGTEDNAPSDSDSEDDSGRADSFAGSETDSYSSTGGNSTAGEREAAA